MARKESDLVASDSWNTDGLVNSHAMHDWAERRIRGILTAELTEACRKRVCENVLGLSMTDSGARETVANWIKNEANKAQYDTIRAELRAEAQDEFDAGTYGTGTRGPVGDPPRVKALWPFIKEKYLAAGQTLDDDAKPAAKAEFVEKFIAHYGDPKRGKYRDEIAKLLATVPQPKAIELAADL